MQKYHYVYRITNIIKQKHYYGTRTSKCLPIEDLGIKYFSSSKDKDFIQDQKSSPSNYKYKIIRIFDTRKEAIELEIKLHDRFDVGINESFYNRSKQTSSRFDTTGLKNTKSQRLLNSAKNSGKNNAMFGRSVYEVWVEKYGVERAIILKNEMFIKRSKSVSGENNPNYGNKWSDYKKELMSIKKRGIKFEKIICPHCGKEGGGPNMTRYHFENCKDKDFLVKEIEAVQL